MLISSDHLNGLPGYTGIEEVDRAGLSVEECADFLARIAAVKKATVGICAGRMTGTPEWELKAALGRWMWEEATDFQALERRISELRSNKSAVKKILDYQLGDFMTELLHSQGSLALCVGLFEVLKPAMCQALGDYLSRTQPLVDQPTVRILKQMLAEEKERLEVGQSIVNVLRRQSGSEAIRADWNSHFGKFLSAAGGISGNEPIASGRPKPRACEEYRISREFVRDARFTQTIPKAAPAEIEQDPLKYMMWIRAQEMTAAEMLASVVFEWDDLPTEGMVDLARHCWDEVRHSLMGCAALEHEKIPPASLPSWTGYAHHTLCAPPPKRYAHLAIATEAAAMSYPGGKRGEWETVRDELKHPLMTTFQDFDWADEVTHVNYGRKWLIDYYFKGDRQAARQIADETVEDRKKFYEQYGASEDIRLGY